MINVMERFLHSYLNNYHSSIRSLLYELSRISNHLLAITTHGIDIGALNGMLLAFEERERMCNILEYLAGSRMHSSLLFIFLLRYDLSYRLLILIHYFLLHLPLIIGELHAIQSSNSVLISRLHEIGKLDRDTIIRSSISGCILRSAGLTVDARLHGLCVYYSPLLLLIIGSKGDCLDRYFIRLNELQQSSSIPYSSSSPIPCPLSIRSY